MKKQLFSLLALLLMAAGGAMAQNENTASVTQLTKNADGNWVLDAMPDYNGVLEVTFNERFKLDSIPLTWTITVNGMDSTEAVTRYSAEEGDTTMGWLMVMEGADVRLTPPVPVKPTVKSVTLVEAPSAVLVESITLNKTATTILAGSTETLSVSSVTPDDATDQSVTWSSDNTDVATVGATTGEVTAVGVGTANITATANDGSGVTATCTVTVPRIVTWNPSDIVPEHVDDDSFTKDGITITAGSCDFQVLTFGGGGTFTTTLGNFTKIEISADFTGQLSGTGWTNDGWQSATWTGNAASVSFSGNIWGGGMTCDGGNLTIVFTIEQ